MFENYLGQSDFKKIVQNYLGRHSMGTATASDFLDSVSRVTSQEIASSFDSFLSQPGVPMVHAELNCLNKVATLTLNQERYAPFQSTIDKSKSWEIPLCISTVSDEKETKLCQIVSQPTTKLEFDSCPTTVNLNPNASGYFLFTEHSFDSAALVENEQSSADALKAQKNLSAQFYSKTISVDTYLDKIMAYKNMTSPRVKLQPIDTFDFLLRHFPEKRTEILSKVKDFYSDSIDPKLNFETITDPENLIYHKKIVQLMMVHDQNFVVPESFKKLAEKKLNAILSNARNHSILDEIDQTLLTYAVQNAEHSTFLKLVSRLSGEKNTNTRNQIIGAISSTNNLYRANAALSLIKQKDVLRQNELFQVGWNLLSYQENQPVVWEWMKENRGYLEENVPRKRLSNLPYTASNFCLKSRKEELLRILGPNIGSIPGGPPALKAVSEQIELCAALTGAN